MGTRTQDFGLWVWRSTGHQNQENQQKFKAIFRGSTEYQHSVNQIKFSSLKHSWVKLQTIYCLAYKQDKWNFCAIKKILSRQTLINSRETLVKQRQLLKSWFYSRNSFTARSQLPNTSAVSQRRPQKRAWASEFVSRNSHEDIYGPQSLWNEVGPWPQTFPGPYSPLSSTGLIPYLIQISAHVTHSEQPSPTLPPI